MSNLPQPTERNHVPIDSDWMRMRKSVSELFRDLASRLDREQKASSKHALIAKGSSIFGIGSTFPATTPMPFPVTVYGASLWDGNAYTAQVTGIYEIRLSIRAQDGQTPGKGFGIGSTSALGDFRWCHINAESPFNRAIMDATITKLLKKGEKFQVFSYADGVGGVNIDDRQISINLIGSE